MWAATTMHPPWHTTNKPVRAGFLFKPCKTKPIWSLELVLIIFLGYFVLTLSGVCCPITPHRRKNELECSEVSGCSFKIFFEELLSTKKRFHLH